MPLVEPRPDGLPGAADFAALGEIEDALESGLAERGVLVLVITTDGMREFVSYVENEEIAAAALSAARAATSTHVCQSYTELDPEWVAHEAYRPGKRGVSR